MPSKRNVLEMLNVVIYRSFTIGPIYSYVKEICHKMVAGVLGTYLRLHSTVILVAGYIPTQLMCPILLSSSLCVTALPQQVREE
jgi:hypothetical protein